MGNIPEKAKEIIKEHISRIETDLPNFLEGYYIYGSASLGAFDYGTSDIDFIAVVKRKATEEDINVLKKVHEDMYKRHKKTILDGMYVRKDDLGPVKKSEDTCLRFNDGKFYGYKKFDKNSIDAYQLKKYGVPMKGQGMELLDYTVDWNILIHNMRDNINTYWVNWMNSCKKLSSIRFIGSFLSLKLIEWGVLGVTRLYYTFRENDMTSKMGAGEYALKLVPEKWHRIINESMRLRKGIKGSYYKSIVERRRDALAYMEHIIQESNRFLEERK